MSGGSLWNRARANARALARDRGPDLLGRFTGAGPVIVPEYQLNPRPRWGWQQAPPAALAEAVAAGDESSLETIEAMLALRDWCRSVPRFDQGDSEPHWDNEFWGGLDAVVQVAELKRRDPALYLEIGSGQSTRFARRAVDEFRLKTKIVSIDPEPRAEIDPLCDEVLRVPAESVPSATFDRLRAGDILFVDGSHWATMNSDSTVLICEVIPSLPAGVLVMIDDVFLPWDYPPSWERRGYAEQYLIATYLLGGSARWSIRFAGWHLTKISPLSSRFEHLWPIVETRFGQAANSFWFETTD